MKILSYKTRLEAIIELAFKPKKFNAKILQSEQQKLNEQSRQLTNQYQEKLEFILHEKEEAAIVSNKMGRNIPVLQIPLMPEPQVMPFNENTSLKGSASIKEFKTEEMVFGLINDRTPLDLLKRRAAMSISNILVKENFLNVTTQGNKVLFSIRIIK